MRTNRQVSEELRVYFWHLSDQYQEGLGYSRTTTLGKLIAGDVGGTMPSSLVPKGIEMTDTEYLRCINRMDLALVSLKSYDNVNESRLWEYIHVKYRLHWCIADLVGHFGVCKRTCINWQNQALVLISEKIS